MTDDPTPRDAAPTPALAAYQLTICGLGELLAYTQAGVTHALSILDPEAPQPSVLAQYPGLRQRWTLRFHDISTPAPDLAAPAEEDVAQILAIGRELATAAAGGHVLVHCHAGVSRSTAAAAILLAHDHPGREEEAFAAVARLRPGAWPNARMVELADALLDRGGRLQAGLRAMQEARLGGGARPLWRL